MKALIVLWISVILPLWTATSIFAKVYQTKEEALKLAFPEADTIEKKVVFLDDKEQKETEAIAKVKMDSKIYTFYTGKMGQVILGYAIFGSHIVRTKPEVYMVVINADGSLKSVEVLAFYEPEEYLPPRRWFDQFAGKVLDDALWAKRGISAVTGATLSANGITQEVRKVLAIFQEMVIKGKRK